MNIGFTATTRIPIAALTDLARLKQLYGCGPRLTLDEEQIALLEAFTELYPSEKMHVFIAAARAGRAEVLGADLLALAQTQSEQNSAVDDPLTMALYRKAPMSELENLRAKVAAHDTELAQHRELFRRLFAMPAVRLALAGADGPAFTFLHVAPAQDKNPAGGSENKPHPHDEALRRGDKLAALARELGKK